VGTGGCLPGALMPCRHPVAVAMSVLWWGLYSGCFGATVGALVGILTDHAPLRPLGRGERARRLPTELGPHSRAGPAGSTALRAVASPPTVRRRYGGLPTTWT
jgi:hypothetical protein